MKKQGIVFFAAFLFFSLLIASFANAQTKDETAIRAVMDKQIKEWNNGNIEGFMQTYWHSDSLLFVGSSGPSYGWQHALEHYKKSYPTAAAMGKLDFAILNIKPLSKEYSFVLGKWHLTRTIGDAGGAFTLLFKKIKGEWFIVADHSS